MKTHQNARLFVTFVICVLPLFSSILIAEQSPNSLENGSVLTKRITQPEILFYSRVLTARTIDGLPVECKLKDLVVQVGASPHKGLKIKGLVKKYDRGVRPDPFGFGNAEPNIELINCVVFVYDEKKKDEWNSRILQALYPLPKIKK